MAETEASLYTTPPLSGKLVIVWCDVHDIECPFHGLGWWPEVGSVIFQKSDAADPFDKAKYRIYQPDLASRRLYKAEHSYFREMMGYARDYNPIAIKLQLAHFPEDERKIYRPEEGASPKNLTYFGWIPMRQVINPFPHWSVDPEIWKLVFEEDQADAASSSHSAATSSGSSEVEETERTPTPLVPEDLTSSSTAP